jgi:alpha-1,3-glucosyltransferase
VSQESSTREFEPSTLTTLLHFSFYLAMIAWHILEAFVAPPPGKPDLWVVLNAFIGAGGFGIAYLWCMWKLFTQCRQIDRQAAEEDSQKKKQ